MADISSAHGASCAKPGGCALCIKYSPIDRDEQVLVCGGFCVTDSSERGRDDPAAVRWLVSPPAVSVPAGSPGCGE